MKNQTNDVNKGKSSSEAEGSVVSGPSSGAPGNPPEEIKAAAQPVADSVVSDGLKAAGVPAGQVNVLDLVAHPHRSAVPEIIRIAGDEVAVILFTPTATPVKVHFAEEPEIRGYVHCAGDGCLLCQAGKHADDKLLLPAYVPTEHRVGNLMVSTSLRPGALLYQLAEPLKNAAAGVRQVMFITRNGSVFSVNARALGADEDDGAASINEFMAGVAEGKIDIRQAVQSVTSDQIMAVPALRRMLELKGVIKS